MMQSFVLAASVFALSQCSHKEQTSEAVESFPVMTPQMKDTVFATDYVASIHSIQFVEVRSRVAGYLEKIHVDEGQLVRKGQILFTIASQEYREELASATAFLTSAIADAKGAELDLKNTQSLVSKNVVSNTELEIAQARLDAANARIREAKAREASASLQLSYTEVRTPFDGLIDRFPNKAGSLINEGDLLTSISDTREVFAYFNFSESEYLNYIQANNKPSGEAVRLILANGMSYTHPGKIETVEGQVNPHTGSIALRARFSNDKGMIRHGSSGKLRIERKIKNALLIPQKSTFEIQENLYVYVMGKDSTVTMRSFIPKHRINDYYIVQSGLGVHDLIVYEGLQRIKEGDKIAPGSVGMPQASTTLNTY